MSPDFNIQKVLLNGMDEPGDLIPRMYRGVLVLSLGIVHDLGRADEGGRGKNWDGFEFPTLGLTRC